MTADPGRGDTGGRRWSVSPACSVLPRRRFVRSVGAGLTVALAGCLGDTDHSSDDRSSADSAVSTTATTAPLSAGQTGSADGTRTATAGRSSRNGSNGDGSSTVSDPDLREANVLGVEIERNESGYRFDVTIHHDDDGEQGYANWWQVETPGGERLGRRELLHAHGSEPFTRSTTIETPENVPRVVVRGHDEIHGYGGLAMIVTLADGTTRAVEQGPEPRAFAPETPS